MGGGAAGTGAAASRREPPAPVQALRPAEHSPAAGAAGRPRAASPPRVVAAHRMAATHGVATLQVVTAAHGVVALDSHGGATQVVELASTWPNPCRLRPKLARLRKLGRFQVKCAPHPGNFGPHQPSRPAIGQIWVEFNHLRSTLARQCHIWRAFHQLRPDFDQLWPEICQHWRETTLYIDIPPTSCGFCCGFCCSHKPALANMSQEPAKFGPASAKSGPNSANIGP